MADEKTRTDFIKYQLQEMRKKTYAMEIGLMVPFFDYQHLPPNLQRISAPFGELASQMLVDLEPGAQLLEAMNLLLKAKDCAVRAALKPGH